MRCGWIYDVLCSADIVCGVVKMHQVVFVHAIGLNKNTTFCVCACWGSSCDGGGTIGMWKTTFPGRELLDFGKEEALKLG